MPTWITRTAYVVIVLVVGPLVAYWIAVAGTSHGLDGWGFIAVLFGLPVVFALLAGALLRVGPRGASAGAIGAAVATVAFVIVLVFVALETR